MRGTFGHVCKTAVSREGVQRTDSESPSDGVMVQNGALTTAAGTR
jgi:hypothetical protein